MANYLTHLKLSTQNKSNRWIVKYDTGGLVKEVKLLFNPKEYKTLKGARKVHTIAQLIKILENDKTQRETK